jgi:hypothetical protein
MMMKEDTIFQRFAELPGATVYFPNEPLYRSVYVPGSRKDRVCICAHTDTVWSDSDKLGVRQVGNCLVSSTLRRGYNDKSGHPFVAGLGIGADDRAGVAMAWALRESGHSILLAAGEELGCLGSIMLAAHREVDEINDSHSFFVELDRRGRNDIVFYNVGSETFVEFCEKSTGYVTAEGTHTDICELCKTICGVNFSVGYMNEHSPSEILRLDWWNRTLNTVGKLLHGKTPRFVISENLIS